MCVSQGTEKSLSKGEVTYRDSMGAIEVGVQQNLCWGMAWALSHAAIL